MIFISLFVTASAVELGDVNADGRVTADDARTALRYSVSLQKLSEDELRKMHESAAALQAVIRGVEF